MIFKSTLRIVSVLVLMALAASTATPGPNTSPTQAPTPATTPAATPAPTTAPPPTTPAATPAATTPVPTTAAATPSPTPSSPISSATIAPYSKTASAACVTAMTAYCNAGAASTSVQCEAAFNACDVNATISGATDKTKAFCASPATAWAVRGSVVCQTYPIIGSDRKALVLMQHAGLQALHDYCKSPSQQSCSAYYTSINDTTAAAACTAASKVPAEVCSYINIQTTCSPSAFYWCTAPQNQDLAQTFVKCMVPALGATLPKGFSTTYAQFLNVFTSTSVNEFCNSFVVPANQGITCPTFSGVKVSQELTQSRLASNQQPCASMAYITNERVHPEQICYKKYYNAENGDRLTDAGCTISWLSTAQGQTPFVNVSTVANSGFPVGIGEQFETLSQDRYLYCIPQDYLLPYVNDTLPHTHLILTPSDVTNVACEFFSSAASLWAPMAILAFAAAVALFAY